MNRSIKTLTFVLAASTLVAACSKGSNSGSDTTVADTTTVRGQDTVSVPTTVPTTDTVVKSTTVNTSVDTLHGSAKDTTKKH